jgi:steroid delta-isomerase-like uncharacterized protein
VTAQDTAALVRSGFDAYNAKDLDKLDALAAPTIEIVDESTGQRFNGIEGNRRFNQMWLSAFPDVHLTITSLVASDTSAAVEFTFEGTHTGTPLVTPSGDIPPTGRHVSASSAGFYAIENGKLTQLHVYYDALLLLQQLGLMPQTLQPQAIPVQAQTQAQAQAQPHM